MSTGTWTIQDIVEESGKPHYANSHAELFATFKDIGGNPVDVNNLTFTIKAGGVTGSVIVPNFLRPAQKDYDEATGKYVVTFITSDWNPGDYYAEFRGNYQSDTLVASGTLSLYTITLQQFLIDSVRTLIKDKLPDLYTINYPSSEHFKWRDGEIYTSLTMALDLINNTPPLALGNFFTLDQAPPSLLINLAMCYCFQMRGMLEIANAVNYVDEIQFSLNRAGGYQTAAQSWANIWFLALKNWKEDYTYRNAQPLGIASLRFPMRFLRALSMTAYNNNFSSLL